MPFLQILEASFEKCSKGWRAFSPDWGGGTCPRSHYPPSAASRGLGSIPTVFQPLEATFGVFPRIGSRFRERSRTLEMGFGRRGNDLQDRIPLLTIPCDLPQNGARNWEGPFPASHGIMGPVAKSQPKKKRWEKTQRFGNQELRGQTPDFLKDAYQLMSGNDPSPATVAELWDLSRGRAKATKDIIPPFQKRQDLEIDEESIKTWMEKLRLCIEECH